MRTCICLLTGQVARSEAWELIAVWSYVSTPAAEATAIKMFTHLRHLSLYRQDDGSTRIDQVMTQHKIQRAVLNHPATLVALLMGTHRFNEVLQTRDLNGMGDRVPLKDKERRMVYHDLFIKSNSGPPSTPKLAFQAPTQAHCLRTYSTRRSQEHRTMAYGLREQHPTIPKNAPTQYLDLTVFASYFRDEVSAKDPFIALKGRCAHFNATRWMNSGEKINYTLGGNTYLPITYTHPIDELGSRKIRPMMEPS